MSLNCPNCKNEFTLNEKFCKVCGYNIKDNFILNPTCPKCSKVYSYDVKFCINDGVKLVNPNVLIPECEICKIQYTDGAKFCPSDGGKIDVRKEYRFDINNSTPTKSKPVEDNSTISQQVSEQYNYNSTQNNNHNSSSSNERILYPKASLGSRFGALLIDSLIIILLAIPSILLLFDYIIMYIDYNDMSISFDHSKLLWGIVALFLPLIYSLIKDGLKNGQSIGKKAVGLMVVNVNSNRPCSKWNSVGRNILSNIISNVPYVGFIIEIVMVFANPQGRKISDLGAATQVIEVKNYKK